MAALTSLHRLVGELSESGALAQGSGIDGEALHSSAAASQLERQQNTCDDWSRVVFSSKEALSPASLSRIRGCHFGDLEFVVIGVLSGSVEVGDGVSLPCGLYDSTFSGRCHISNHARVSATLALRNVFVGEHASIVGCGKVVCDTDGSGTAFGTGETISLGPENGGRGLTMEAGLTYSAVCRQVFCLPAPAASAASRALGKIRCGFTVVGPHARVFRCDVLRNSYIGPHAQVSSSTLDCCCLVSSQARLVRVSGGAALIGCVLHEGCSATACRADRAFLLETAALGENARVSQSVVAPDSTVAGGECHHSLVGPFVGFHHTSLLIAALWPLGRGNVGYGAMCGSNHTGRVNDQECWLGEGCFLGLGSAVKFPCNLLESPYSLVASGCRVPPLRLSWPFSLLLEAAGCAGLQCKPGWVLYASPYTLERSAAKFASRQKATQHCTGFPIMRPSTAELVRAARDVLLEQQEKQQQPQQAGVVVSEVDSVRALAAYTSFLRRYALHGLCYLVQDAQRREGLAAAIAAAAAAAAAGATCAKAISASGPASSRLPLLQQDLALLEAPSQPQAPPLRSDVPDVLAHQLLTLVREYPLCAAPLQASEPAVQSAETRRLLEALVLLETSYCQSVAESKRRDADRGREVIPDYEEVNGACREAARPGAEGRDAVVETAHRRVLEVQRVLDTYPL